MKKILKIRGKKPSRITKILISGGVLLSSGAITGGIIYKFVLSEHMKKTLNAQDVIDWDQIAPKSFKFVGQDGKGTITYDSKNFSNKIIPKFTVKNPGKSIFQDKDFKFKSNQINNLANGDAIFVRFFSLNPSKYSLNNKLKSNLKLDVSGLSPIPPKPTDLSSELAKFSNLESGYTSSQLFDKFHSRLEGAEISATELKLLNDSSIELKDGIRRQYKFNRWNSTDNNYLEIKVILTSNDPVSNLTFINNEKIIKINPSNDYSYVQQEIESTDNNQVFVYKENSEKDPDDWNLSKSPWPSNFSLEEFYGYSLPGNISTNIRIQKYTDVKWDEKSKLLSVKANIIDNRAPKQINLINTEISINIKLIAETEVLDKPIEVINKLNDEASLNNPGKSNFNNSQLKDLFDRKGVDFELESEDFGYYDFPMANKLQDDYFIEGWDDTNKLLKIKVKVKDTSDSSIDEQMTTIYIRGTTNLNPEKQKIDDFFFSNKIYYTNKTELEINTLFNVKKDDDPITLDSSSSDLILNYKNPSNLTKGINLVFKYIKWDEEYNILDLKAHLIDSNSPNGTQFTNNEVRVSIKIIPRYDFTNDLAQFPNDTNNIFNSSLSYSELFDKFNSNDGIEAKNQGDAISAGSFGFNTPPLSKRSIKANYELEEWNNTTKQLKVKVILIDTDSPGVVFQNNIKIFTINGSTNLKQELKNVEETYTVFTEKKAKDIDAHFSQYKVAQKFDFENEFPNLNFQTPSLTQGIMINYGFESYDSSKNELKIKARVKDSHAPTSIDQTSLDNYKEIIIQVVPAYDYAKIVKEFNEAIPKQINSLNASELYNIFYDKDGKSKYQKGDIIHPEDFNYSTPILIPKNINVTYKFNSWDYQQNLLKIDVSLKNNDIPDLIKELGEDFTLEFYGSGNLKDEIDKIKVKSSNPHNFNILLLAKDQESWINDNIPINQEFALKDLMDILDIETYNVDLRRLAEKSGFNDLYSDIEIFLTRTNMTKDNGGNLILNFSIRLNDKYLYKAISPSNNIFQDFKIRLIPEFDIHFLSYFIYNVGVPKPTSLNPKGVIDLRGVKEIMDKLKVHRRGWDWSKVDPNNSKSIKDFFHWIFGWDNYGKPGHWSLDSTFKFRKLIDPNTGQLADASNYDITIQTFEYDTARKSVVTRITFELNDASRQKHGYPKDMQGDTKTEVWQKLYFKVG